MIFDIDSPTVIPAGSTVTSTDPLTVDFADYDYRPFANPDTPAFDFIADVLHPDGRIDRGILCTSHPGRHTTIKEQ